MEGEGEKNQRIGMGKGDSDIGRKTRVSYCIIKRRKLKYYGHQTRKQAMVKVLDEARVEGSRGCDRPKRQWAVCTMEKL